MIIFAACSLWTEQVASELVEVSQINLNTVNIKKLVHGLSCVIFVLIETILAANRLVERIRFFNSPPNFLPIKVSDFYVAHVPL